MSLEFDETATDPGKDAPPAAASGLVGKRLAHFEIESKLGQGGMGEVYRARDLALDRPVAIKILGSDVADSDALRERFFREARAQARIQHANVCHIYFIGDHDGHLFFAMELIEGPSLAAVLKDKGRLGPEAAIEYCRQAALGLREAQRHGFTHRDVKPSNLMVDHHDTVKVVDFGIVKKAATDGDTGGDLTLEKSVVGTPLYVSPEQARGDAVDFRSDIYSLGATLHELISGDPPFAGGSAMKIIARHLTDDRPRFELPKQRKLKTGAAELDALVDRMMAKDPGDRFQSYDELIAAFEVVSPARVKPAGVAVRGFALAIDVLIGMAILTLPIEFLAGVDDESIAGRMAGPILFMVYVIIAHARWGQTAGKRLLEVEVAPMSGSGRIGLKSSALRFVVQFGPFYVLKGLTEIAELATNTRDPVIVFMILVPGSALVYALWLGWGTASKRTYWDRLAGTRVLYRR